MPASLPANAQAAQSGHGIANHPAVSSNVKADSKSTVAAEMTKARYRAHATASQLQKTSAPSAQPAATPPPIPVPPADQPASPATISFDQGVLSIHAQNSSLVTILNQVSRKTGLTIEGLNRDKRVYGEYGPGNLTSTLTALLDGSGYNYVIIGGDSSHTPSKLILTQNSSPGSTALPVAAGNGVTAQIGTDSVPAAANPSAPVRAKTPQEIFDELRKMHPQ